MVDLKDFVEEVKRANDIVSVISGYLEVKQKGQNFWARCPFHGEKTPSFSINPHQQYYKCFGCQESGDVIKFVQQYESCSFMEALEILAKRANIKMPELKGAQVDKQLQERKKKRDVYLDILKDTAKFYWKNFYAPHGQKAREYMQKRGFSEDTLKKFGIGYSPNMQALVDYLNKSGYNMQDALDCGVLQRTNDGKYFDALCGRLIVPIFDISGKVIAFGGRALDEKTQQYGKYKNTAETQTFSKKNNLYAINFAKKEKQQANLPYIVMVEGYMDVIAMAQAGFCQCVASMGTSLTEQQAKLVSRLCDTVYICYDGDSAGQKATIRGLDILAEQGLNVFVMSIPDNQDPDEYIKAHGKTAFGKLIEQAKPLIDYKLSVLANYFQIYTVDPAHKNDAIAKYIKGAVKLLAQLDTVTQGQYITYVSAQTGFAEEYILRAIATAFQQNAQTVTENALQNEQVTYSTEDNALFFVASAILNGMSYAHIDNKPYCTSKFLQQVYDYIFDCYSKGEKPSMNMIFTVVTEQDNSDLAKLTEREFVANNQLDKQYFDECVKMIERTRLRKQREQIQQKLKDINLDEKQFAELAQQIDEINKQIDKI